MCISVGGVRGTGFFSNIVFVVVAMMEGWSGTGRKEEKRRNALFGPSATGAVEPESEALQAQKYRVGVNFLHSPFRPSYLQQVLEDAQCFNDGWGNQRDIDFKAYEPTHNRAAGCPPGTLRGSGRLVSPSRASRRAVVFETGVFEKDRYLGYISYKAQREPTASRRLSGVRRASGRYCSTRKIYECQTRRSDTFLGSESSIGLKKEKNETVWIGQVSRELLGKEAAEDKFAGVSLGCSTGVKTLRGEQNVSISSEKASGKFRANKSASRCSSTSKPATVSLTEYIQSDPGKSFEEQLKGELSDSRSKGGTEEEEEEEEEAAAAAATAKEKEYDWNEAKGNSEEKAERPLGALDRVVRYAHGSPRGA
ncbi:hypothetical protein HZH68_000109 [Vespula germanica]|uniref:Uncharacterized protein n=1 Tax=Vespula germanica TaxID=30212 RepID=A0A834NT41_VESGE|nr:hypothetical protein HZH68_000109 [Vespula germanica]